MQEFMIPGRLTLVQYILAVLLPSTLYWLREVARVASELSRYVRLTIIMPHTK